MDKKTILKADRVRALLKENGLTMKFFNDKFGKNRSFLSNVLSGSDNIDEAQIEFLADKLHTTPEYLKGETDKKERPDTQSIKPNDKDMRLVNWFRSLPVEKRKAILDLGDGPKDLVE